MPLLVDIEKKLENFQLKVSFEAGLETLALLGASGSGKSMTLKCIAGIEKPDRGRIVLDGVTLFDSRQNINLSVQQRRTGLVFQNYALFPNMTVMQNVAAGARREKNAAKRAGMVREIMERFGLMPEAQKYPCELSGGQQQRTALARVLVSAPNLLLLDEPFSALDGHLRFRLEQEVRQAIAAFGKTVLLVSHDRDEVYRMADRIAVMKNGRIETAGEKHEVFGSPGTKDSAVLTGCKNISAAKILDRHHVLALDWGLKLYVPGVREDVKYVGIRMHEIQGRGKGDGGRGENVQEADRGGSEADGRQEESRGNYFQCIIEDVIENPFSYTVLLRGAKEGGQSFGWEVDKKMWNAFDYGSGQTVEIRIPPEAVLLLKE